MSDSLIMYTTPSTAVDQLKTFFMPSTHRDDISYRFAHRVRTLRQERSQTQAQLAAQCGLSEEHVRQIEGGQMTPTLVVLELLALGFQMSISGLVEEL